MKNRKNRADLSWLENPEVFAVNTVAAHSDHVVYASDEQLLQKKSSLIQNLDGRWKLNYVKNINLWAKDFYENGFDDSGFGFVDVPANLELQGYGKPQYVNVQYPFDGHEKLEPPLIPKKENPVASYVRYFDLANGLKDKRVNLRFEGAATAIYVWLNGKFVGYSEDSFTPSEFEVTEFLQEKNNRLCVAVFKYSSASWLEDQDFWRLTGIFRSVELRAKADLHLEDVHLTPTLSKNLSEGQLKADFKLDGDIDNSFLSCELMDNKGQVIRKTEVGVENKRVHLNWRKLAVLTWSSENPNLYFLRVKLYLKDKLQEVSQVQLGFRSFKLRDGIMYLNNRRIVFKGVNRHEFDCQAGRAISKKDIAWDLKTMKRNHINAVRTSHYPNQTYFYEMCDRLGLYVIDETNLETHGTWQKVGKEDATYNVPASKKIWLAACLDRANNMMQRDYNHPCVLIWSCGNESYAGSVIAKMADFLRKNDLHRLVHYEGVTHNRKFDQASDIESRMYAKPHEIEEYLMSNPKKPYISCEYMHAMGNSVGDLQSYTALEKYPQYQGGFIWDFIDQGIEKNGSLAYGGDFDDRPTDYEFCGDGLVFANRVVSPKMAAVKALYNNVQMKLNDKELTVENKNLFIDLEKEKFVANVLLNGRVIWSHSLTINVMPTESGVFKIKWPKIDFEPTDELIYQVSEILAQSNDWADAGYQLGKVQFLVHKAIPTFEPDGAGTPIDSDYNFGFSGHNYSILLSKERGKLVSINYGGSEFLQTLMQPTFWRPLTDNDRGACYGFEMAQWENAGKFMKLVDLNFEKEEEFVEINAQFDLPVALKDKLDIRYRIDKSGKINIQAIFPGAQKVGKLPLFGLEFAIPNDYDRYQYYGLGPNESYSDRLAGSYFGIYKGKVQDNLTPYLRLQECGNRSQVRQYDLLNKAGDGIRILANKTPLNVSALPYSTSQLETTDHLSDLGPSRYTYVRVIAAQMGVGGDDSWGAQVHPEFLLDAQDRYVLDFTLAALYKNNGKMF
ncbi:glycoside hydrolase family 2 TIM barrel-domain containing protein [uncultured Lactobacillus sp.]|uniref:glycoside hydrolase family 2 TIM barrel-domain containing protein n=1 Tax=uncultured Lactobacillus sp. TaxID=153152 RepID=UPI002621A459|nr:glycoside hydrolase family 2 TIM barrel-domain containing protein [uncultured Lactobacillus sp.]